MKYFITRRHLPDSIEAQCIPVDTNINPNEYLRLLRANYSYNNILDQNAFFEANSPKILQFNYIKNEGKKQNVKYLFDYVESVNTWNLIEI